MDLTVLHLAVPRLTIDLQTGFANDEVILRVAGIEVLRRSEVTTNLAISLADSHQTEVEGNPVDVEVLVSTRKLKGAVQLDDDPLAQSVWLAMIAPEMNLNRVHQCRNCGCNEPRLHVPLD